MAKIRFTTTKPDKPLYVKEDKPYRPIGIAEIVLTMLAILLILWGLDVAGIIELKQTQGL